MVNSQNTFEHVWASLQETNRILSERQAETDRQIKKVNETLGSWAYNQGRFAEEYFFNSFEKGKQNFFGEKFDEIEENVKGIKKGFKDESPPNFVLIFYQTYKNKKF